MSSLITFRNKNISINKNVLKKLDQNCVELFWSSIDQLQFICEWKVEKLKINKYNGNT